MLHNKALNLLIEIYHTMLHGTMLYHLVEIFNFENHSMFTLVIMLCFLTKSYVPLLDTKQ